MSADPGHDVETTSPIPLEERPDSRVTARPAAPDLPPLHVQQPHKPQQNQQKGQQQKPKQHPSDQGKGRPDGAPDVVALVKIRDALEGIRKTMGEVDDNAAAANEEVAKLSAWMQQELQGYAAAQKRMVSAVEAQTKAVTAAINEQRRIMNALALTPDGRAKLKAAATGGQKPWWKDWRTYALMGTAAVIGAFAALVLGG
jgi:hypothetical protein